MSFFSNLFKTKRKEPEDYYVVKLDEFKVSVEHKKFGREEVYFENLTEINLINTDEGPWLPDIWLDLVSVDSKCRIPQGAHGYEEVFDKVSKYDGFDFGNVIKSNTCTDNRTFNLWNKKSA